MLKEILKSIKPEDLIKCTLSKPDKENTDFIKVTFRLVETKNKPIIQIESLTNTQAFHENIEITDFNEKFENQFGSLFKQAHIFTKDYEYRLKISKKGKLLTSKTKNKNQQPSITSHNKKKKYIIDEGTKVPPLIDLGVMNKDGYIIKSKYDKFKQINRFIEMVDDVIKDYNKETINVIDFGCGKSYLTFILYYYLKEIKNIDCKITGLDLKSEVIKKCNEISNKYNYSKLKFEVGNINGYKTDEKVDMVITLHACDTATDAALINAIDWGAEIIMSVPCCQHEINSQVGKNTIPGLTNYGLVKERFSALLTDSIRGQLLEAIGYKVNLMEFIDISHTPKNILIRATKTSNYNMKALENVESMLNQYNLKHSLYDFLEDKLLSLKQKQQ